MNRRNADTTNSLSLRGCGPFVPVSGSPDSLKLAIFERIRAEGSIARAAIAKDLAISPATVTTQTSALIEAGFVREESRPSDSAETGRGRPRIALAVEPKAHLVAGLKLSDKEHSAVIYDFAGQKVASASSEASDSKALGDVTERAKALVRMVCDEAGIGVRDLSAICIGVPGFIKGGEGIAYWSPLIDETAVPLARLMEEKLGKPVIIENDANLIALAELWFGVGRQISDFAVVTIEHGVGLGLVINHRLYVGARGMGMELAHTKVALNGALCRCGQRGCLEAYVADYALVREAALAAEEIQPNAPIREVLEVLYAEAKNGNLVARSIFERAGKYLAMGLANVANLFDPQLIILSGERMQYDYLHSDEILEEMERHALNSGVTPPPVEVHAWGDLVWASGAAAKALSYVTENELSDRMAV